MRLHWLTAKVHQLAGELHRAATWSRACDRQLRMDLIILAECAVLLFIVLFIVGRRIWRARVLFASDTLTRFWTVRLPTLLEGGTPHPAELRRQRSRMAFERVLLDRLENTRGAERDAIRRLIDRAGIVEYRIYRLQRGRRWERLYSAALLGELRAPAAVKTLIERLSSPWGEKRTIILRSLAAIGSTDAGPAIVRTLILRRPVEASAWVEAAATCVLPYQFRPLLRHARPEVRSLALRAIAESHFPAQFEDIHYFAFDVHSDVRVQVCRALCRTQPTKAGIVLSALAGDELPAVRIAALLALGDIGGHFTLPAVLRATGDRDARVRQTAAFTLARLSHTATNAPAELIRILLQIPDRAGMAAYLGQLARAGLLWRVLALLAGSTAGGGANAAAEGASAAAEGASVSDAERASAAEFLEWAISNGYYREVLHALESHVQWRVRIAAARLLAQAAEPAAIDEIERHISVTIDSRTQALLAAVVKRAHVRLSVSPAVAAPVRARAAHA